MEVDPVKWITDVENSVNKNAQRLSALSIRVEGIKDEIAEHRIDSKARSDDRLEQIIDRFDRLDSISSKRIGMTLSFFAACCTAVWFVVVLPMQEQLAVIDRRLIDAERDIAVLSASSDEL